MCEVFAGQDPQRYRPVNRSVRIDGHSTSIQLESAFWTLIDEMSASQGLSTSRFLSLLHDEALEINGSVSNFASLLRTSCLIYLANRSQSAETDSNADLQMVAAE